jgi:hypothetical protein
MVIELSQPEATTTVVLMRFCSTVLSVLSVARSHATYGELWVLDQVAKSQTWTTDLPHLMSGIIVSLVSKGTNGYTHLWQSQRKSILVLIEPEALADLCTSKELG